MKNLNLEKLHQICNKLSYEETKLSEEQDKWVSLLGNGSNYYASDFEHFLFYYSFKVDKNVVVVFNDNGVPYESFNNNDFSYIPVELLNMSELDLDTWIEVEVEKQLEAQRVNNLAEKENIREQIKRLEKQLENYEKRI